MKEFAFFTEIERNCFWAETIQLKQDFETIFQLIPIFSAYPELAFGFIPYFSLAAVNGLEYLESYNDFNVSERIPDLDTHGLKDIRAKLKVFDSGYKKSKKLLLNIDYIQDQIFRESNAAYCFYTKQQYPNLGIYTDSNNRIIGNTHYSYYIMQDTRMVNKSLESIKQLYSESPNTFSHEFLGNESFRIAHDCGSVLGSILAGLIELELPIMPETKDYRPNILYADVNTNDIRKFIRNEATDKSIFLYILQVLTSVNFVIFIISMCDKNIILFSFVLLLW